MHRIDTPTAQKDKFGAGKNGFTAGNPQTGTPATDLDNDYFDMLQEELAGVVEATGVNLDKSKHNQLLTALKALLLSRAHPFADIKADGPAAIAEALSNLGLGDVLHAGAGRLLAGTYVSSAVDATSIGVRAASGCQFMRAHKAPDAPDQSNYWQVIVLPETTESSGRVSCLAMSGNDIHLGNGDASGISTWTILSGRQPASDTLTALSMLATGANQLPYFTGIGKVSQTPLTQMGRDIIGLTSVADALSYLGISSNLVPVGVPLPWPLAVPPSGWLLCNGQTFTTAQYPALAVAYPGLATPDLRGLFIRGLDNGRGYDPLRDLGTEQLDAFASHRHQPEQSGAGNRFVADYSENGSGSGAQITMGSNNYAMCRYTNYVGGTETRPRNFALNYIVRAA